MMISEQDPHLGQSTCVLCRQAPTVGSHILDLNQKLHPVPECRSPCAGCSYSPYPAVWFHAPCYDVLQHSYDEPSEKPTPDELRRFADAIRPVYQCHARTRNIGNPCRFRKASSASPREEFSKTVSDRTCWGTCRLK
ncbi:hypothetical protein BO71DRAFT_404140 [Aspergillus ellipticus CBS 707.79]|uniref:Uncharacterized protein n=1 Tax=Aspergillus ellipticus CBS 707.79 TaxID=1448320 RepID=A0A319CUI7_9EURO|nr:hypothetical protein BO71DRAFT_404140 [Aspergillus ellipticus CBS 707.79]